MIKKATISTKDQVILTENLLAMAEVAKRTGDAVSLEMMSRIASLLLPYADESVVTLMFDLGEYLHECSTDVYHPEKARDNGWRDEALKHTQESLLIARRHLGLS